MDAMICEVIEKWHWHMVQGISEENSENDFDLRIAETYARRDPGRRVARQGTAVIVRVDRYAPSPPADSGADYSGGWIKPGI